MKRFVSSSFDRQTLSVMKEITAIRKLLRHRATNPESNANFEMLKKVAARLNAVKQANTASLRFDTACKLSEYFYNNEQIDKLIDDLLCDCGHSDCHDKKSLLLKLISFFRKECSLQSLPKELFSDKQLSSMLISFLTKSGV